MPKATNITDFFYNCKALKEIKSFTVADVTTMHRVFCGCYVL